MGERDEFVKQEDSASATDSARVLARFVLNLRLFCLLFIPGLLCSIAGAAGYQGFVWLSGEVTRCPSLAHCVVTLPRLGWSVPLSLILVGAFGCAVVTLRVLGWICFEVGGQISSLPLFRRMLAGLGTVRTTFFDEHPSGRIINRVVRDFDTLRVMGVIRIGDTINALVELGVIAVIVGFVHPAAGFVILPTLAVFLYIQRQVAPMLQRCLTVRSVRFSEVLHRETDAIEGIRSFVLYGHERALFRRLTSAMTAFTQMHLLRAKVEAWGRFWSNAASALCSGVALSAVAVAVDNRSISATVAAVVITATFRLSGSFGWLTWTVGYLFESSAHARRVFQYVDLPHESGEEGLVPQVTSAPSLKPHSGALSFKNYAMSYRKDSPLVLKNLTFSIPPQTHVGIIGRTGAGKSSLVQALYRMVYVHQGDILVGDTSLFSLPVEESRTLFTVVPQDPYLFAGTVRSNLDPLALHSDDELQAALKAVQWEVSLTAPINEAGRNLSLGQRQLVSLARVLISKAPFVVMDEPTSSVDSITDSIVQRVLRTALRERTVLTIAHRLETLALVDLVLEIKDGELARTGTVAEILPSISEAELG